MTSGDQEIAERAAARGPELIPPSPADGWRETVAASLAFLVILIFAVLMYRATSCVLYIDPCPRGMEVMNLLGHIFGPIIGAIVAFYFTHLIILRS